MSVRISRRAFLAAGALAGVGWAGALASRAVAAPPLASTRLGLRRSAFLPLLGHTFLIAHDRVSLSVVLRQISDLDPTIRPGAEDQFSLIFTASRRKATVPQGTYTVSYPGRGRISLFLVPIGRRAPAQHYQAIIDSRPQPRSPAV